MDEVKSLLELNDIKKSVDAMIERMKNATFDARKGVSSKRTLIVILSIIGAAVVVGVTAYLVYKHFASDSLDEEDYDLDDLINDDDDDASDDDDEPEVIIAHKDVEG